MKQDTQIKVAVVGLGFGAEFVPLWQKHPHTNCVAICQRNPKKLNAVGDYFGGHSSMGRRLCKHHNTGGKRPASPVTRP